MLSEGASPDAMTSSGLTALHLAVRAGRTTIINLILAKHPDLSLRNRAGQTAYQDALQSGKSDIIGAFAGYAIPLSNVSYNISESKSIVDSLLDTIWRSCFANPATVHVADQSPQTESINDSQLSFFARIPTGPQ